MIIRRGSLFITIVLLLLFPWQTFGESNNKKASQKQPPATAKKVVPSKSSPKQLKAANKKSKKSLRSKKRKSQKVAQEKPPVVRDALPLIKITPLDDGKFLLEPMDHSTNKPEGGTDSLSLIKKPVFEEELKTESPAESSDHPLAKFPNLLIDISKQLLGKSYRLGGSGQGSGGIDCSGFVKKIYQSLTLSLPHSSREQAKLGALVTTEWDLSRLKIGDLLFFKRNKGVQIGHTGMYIGEGKMIHSASKKGVVISNLKASNYYHRNFVMAKRLFILDNPQLDEFKEFKGPLTPKE